MNKLLAASLLLAFQCAFADDLNLQTTQSLYLGEVKTVSIQVSEALKGKKISWKVDKKNLAGLNSGDLITVEPRLHPDANRLDVKIIAPYIAPSFENVSIAVTGSDETQQKELVKLNVNLSVRAELVIRFRKMTETFVQNNKLSAQSDSDFEWDVPIDPLTGTYIALKVNNHPRGLWVRFRYDDPQAEPLLRKGGYVIHIYKGEGEYIVHQPFDPDTHLQRSNCSFEPISSEEWKNPELGLKAEGQPWANCEFRGFVPAGAAYGFQYREHYLEKEQQKKIVSIENLTGLDTELIELYKFYEEQGMSIGELCKQW